MEEKIQDDVSALWSNDSEKNLLLNELELLPTQQGKLDRNQSEQPDVGGEKLVNGDTTEDVKLNKSLT